MEENLREISLLQSDPPRLVIHYQPFIKTIVKAYLNKGFLPMEYRDDMSQHISEQLLIRMPKIREKFNGSVKLRTYFSVIINNLCYDYGKANRKDYQVEFQDFMVAEDQAAYNPAISRLALEGEFKRVEKVFQLYGKQLLRIQLCFRVLYGIPLKREDSLKWLGEEVVDKFAEYFSSFAVPGQKELQKELIQKLSDVFNFVEGKDKTPDALRKWFDKTEEECIKLMNGNPPRSSYTEETFRTLLEHYFAK